jgi:nucleotide-binding universal stress UspA family protein
MPIQHILITSDLSSESLRPSLPIAEMARALGARVTLLHVSADAPVAGATAGELPSVLPEQTAKLDAARALLEEHIPSFAGVDVRVVVLPGLDPVYEIVQFAESNGVDLIAMSTHGRTGFQRLVIGSVAEALLRRSTRPLMVFPRAAEATADAA